MNYKNYKVNHGFIEPKILDEHYRFGSGQVTLDKPIQLDSDWTSYLPIGEDQLKQIETFNCSGFATTNQIEAYLFKKFNITANYSDRFLGIMAGTAPPLGNDPQSVYEAVRKYGLIPEEMCPFSEDIKTAEEYYSWKGCDKDACIAEGKRWLRQFKFFHDWVAHGEMIPINIIRTALQYSPVCIAVYAWATNDIGKYVRLGADTHWTMAYRLNSYLDDFDSYEPNKKQLVSDFGIKYAKRIHIEPNTDPDTIGLMQQLIELLTKLRDMYQQLIQKIYGAIKKTN